MARRYNVFEGVIVDGEIRNPGSSVETSGARM